MRVDVRGNFLFIKLSKSGYITEVCFTWANLYLRSGRGASLERAGVEGNQRVQAEVRKHESLIIM